MRMSEWSSDVCSSDLSCAGGRARPHPTRCENGSTPRAPGPPPPDRRRASWRHPTRAQPARECPRRVRGSFTRIRLEAPMSAQQVELGLDTFGDVAIGPNGARARDAETIRQVVAQAVRADGVRSEEHTSELQSLMR